MSLMHFVVSISLVLALTGATRAQQHVSQVVTASLPLSHSTEFAQDHLRVTGVIENPTDIAYPCLMILFNVVMRGGVSQQVVTVHDVPPRSRRSFEQVMPPGEQIGHRSTFTCADPIAKAPPAPPPRTKTQPQARQTCSIAGTLRSDSGFRLTVRETRDGPTATVALTHIELSQQGRTLHRTRLVVSGGQARYRFDNVEVGETFALALSRSRSGPGQWVFKGFAQVSARCTRAGATRVVQPQIVTYFYES